jgi:hypothetical protein
VYAQAIGGTGGDAGNGFSTVTVGGNGGVASLGTVACNSVEYGGTAAGLVWGGNGGIGYSANSGGNGASELLNNAVSANAPSS